MGRRYHAYSDLPHSLPLFPLTGAMLLPRGHLPLNVFEPRYLEMLASRAPKHWEKKSLQVVLATDIVRGNTGPPRILATHFW